MSIELLIAKAHQKGLFLNEDFKTMKVKYLSQGIDSNIVDNYINTFKSIKDLKELNDDIQNFPIPRGNDRKNIDNYKDFHTLETIVDYVKGKRDIKTASFDNKQNSSNDESLTFPGNVVIKNDELEVKYADSPRACIEYKGKFPYSWCISRTDASNMFSTYRFQEYEPAFYFVKRIKATEKEFGLWNMTKNVFNGTFKDKYHFFVVQVVKNADVTNTTQQQYIVTSAENDGDIRMTWDDILKFAPELNGLQSKFIAVPLTPNEKATFDKYVKGISDEEFSKLDYKEKRNYLDIYVKMDKPLTDNQFDVLPDDLKGLYIGFGVPLSKGIFEFVMSNGKLKKRYDEILKRRIEELLKGTRGVRFGGDEVLYALKNGLIDGNKLDSDMIDNLLKYAPTEQQYVLIQQIFPLVKAKLNSNIINELLKYTPKEQRYELFKQIFSLVKDKLNSNIINELLDYTPTEQQYALIQQIFPLVKDKLDSYMVNILLRYTPEEQRYVLVKQIFPLVKDKLDSYMVNTLLGYTPEEQRYELIQQILPLVKDMLDSNMVGELLYYTPTEQRYELFKQIFPLVKDKLDSSIVLHLIKNTPEEQRFDILKQTLSLIKDELIIDDDLNNDLVYDLRGLFNDVQDRNTVIISLMTPLIAPLINDGILYDLKRYVPIDQYHNLVKQILPYVKDKLDGNMVDTLLRYTPKEHKQEIQSLINQYKRPALNEKVINKLRVLIREELSKNKTIYN
jgi:F0F1-type ATP synthase delta subunit